MQGWLFTILHNSFLTKHRKRKEAEDPDGTLVESLITPPDQEGRVEFRGLQRALGQLLPEQREALVLVGAHGFSYEEAAKILKVPTGTVKSRVSNARERLARLLGKGETESPTDDMNTPPKDQG